MENEIDLSDTLEETIENIMGKKSHVWVTLGKGDHKVKVKALIDTGNTIKEETAITEELHSKLNVGLKEMGGAPIGTANKEGPKLRKFGVSNPIQMIISGIKGRFEVQPAVVSTLSDPFNIGQGFMESIGNQMPVSVGFQNGKTVLKIGNMETELIRQISEVDEMEQKKVDQEDHGKGNGSQVDQDIH